MRQTPLTRRTPLRNKPKPVEAPPVEEDREEVRARRRARRWAEKEARLAAMTPQARADYEARLEAVRARTQEKAERRAQDARAVALKAWHRIRHAVWERDDECCVRCLKHLPIYGVAELDLPQCHHRKLRSRGGEDGKSNLITLCARCHDWAHKHNERATELGYIVASSMDPALVPVVCKRRGRILLADDGSYGLAA